MVHNKSHNFNHDELQYHALKKKTRAIFEIFEREREREREREVGEEITDIT